MLIRLLILLSLLFCVVDSYARVETQLDLYDRIHILSDKQYRHGKEGFFEAVGNVVARFQDKSLYGEKLTVDSNTGEIHVFGNVRYVAAGVTLYGSEMYYNTKSGRFDVKNARIHSSNFVILGKQLSKMPDGSFIGKDAEYTTCMDCPESWIIQGKEVSITIDQYISIKHALVKAKGVIIMYVPYIIFPIKKQRETGLLFPHFSIDISEGATFQQPFFWAIGPYNDATFTPSIWGNRGYGSELQYRHNIGDRKWFEINSMGVFDQLYELNKNNDVKNDKSYFRLFGDYEHQFNFGRNFSHHLQYTGSKELDFMRDFTEFTQDRIDGGELGASGFFDYRAPSFDLSIEGGYQRNLLYSDASGTDKEYVQVLPKVSLSTVPYSLIHTDLPLLSDISIGLDANATRFRQLEKSEGNFIRNADRYTANPYINWNLGRFGPFFINSSGKFNYQSYFFPYEDDRYFRKTSGEVTSEVFFEIERIFGLAYKEKVSDKKVELVNSRQNSELIGPIPDYSAQNKGVQDTLIKNSYRHSQSFSLKHYYTFRENVDGNSKFATQIDDTHGPFDYTDVLRKNEHQLENAAFRQEIPASNTLELKWNNSIIKKTPKAFDPYEDHKLLRDNFSYSKVAYFNLSQGYRLYEIDGEDSNLTRLHLSTGISLAKTSFSASEYFFYHQQRHIFNMNVTQHYGRWVSSLAYNYDNASDPEKQDVALTLLFTPADILSTYFKYDYDIQTDVLNQRELGLTYRPLSKCWVMQVSQKKTQIDTKYSFNFLINFNDENFNSLDTM